jgi:hypothetical protein
MKYFVDYFQEINTKCIRTVNRCFLMYECVPEKKFIFGWVPNETLRPFQVLVSCQKHRNMENDLDDRSFYELLVFFPQNQQFVCKLCTNIRCSICSLSYGHQLLTIHFPQLNPQKDMYKNIFRPLSNITLN